MAQFVRSVQGRDNFTDAHRKSIKTLIKAGELRPILFGLSVSQRVSLSRMQTKGLWYQVVHDDKQRRVHMLTDLIAICHVPTDATCLSRQVLDTLALNCSQHVRSLLADKKVLKRISGLANDRTPAAGAAFQLFVNWSFIYRYADHVAVLVWASDRRSSTYVMTSCSE